LIDEAALRQSALHARLPYAISLLNPFPSPITLIVKSYAKDRFAARRSQKRSVAKRRSNKSKENIS